MSSTDKAPTWDLTAGDRDAASHPGTEPPDASPVGSSGEADASGDGTDMGGLSYEEALGEVRDIIRSLEDGTVSVDRLLTAADRGRALLALCERRLSSVEEGLA